MPADVPAGSDIDAEVYDDDLAELGYADAVAELEEILAQLDDDDIDVDHLATQVRRAAALIAMCRGRLSAARVEVTRIVADLDALGATDEGAEPSTAGPSGLEDDATGTDPGALPLDDLEGADG
jgi:exodeoxyribonuclease VII small subunit